MKIAKQHSIIIQHPKHDWPIASLDQTTRAAGYGFLLFLLCRLDAFTSPFFSCMQMEISRHKAKFCSYIFHYATYIFSLLFEFEIKKSCTKNIVIIVYRPPPHGLTVRGIFFGGFLFFIYLRLCIVLGRSPNEEEERLLFFFCI